MPTKRDQRTKSGLVVQRFQPVYGRALAAEILADTPKAFWKCQETARTFPQDASGNALHMATEDKRGVWKCPGPFAYSCDASRQPPQNPHEPNDWALGMAAYRRSVVSTVVNNWTMEILVCPQGPFSDVQMIMGNGDGSTNAGGASTGYDLFWSGTGGKFQVGYRGVAVNSDSAVTCAINTWYHLIVCRDAGTLKYYVNGAVDTANAGTGAPATPINGSVGGTKIGNQGAVSQFIAYAAFYETALSAARAAAHYGAIVGG